MIDDRDGLRGDRAAGRRRGAAVPRSAARRRAATPSTSATRSPSPTSWAVTSRFDHSSARSSHSAVATWLGAGRMKSSTPPRRRRAPRRRAAPRAAAAAAIISAAPPAPLAQRRRRRVGRARGRGARRELGDHAAGPGREDDDAVGQQDGLLDVVGDEQHGARLAASAPARARPASRARVIASSAPNGSSRHRTGLPGQQRAQEGDALAHAAARARGARARSKPSRPKAAKSGCARRARLVARRARPGAAPARRCRARSATAAGGRAGA